MKIANDKVVSIHYTLKNKDGMVLDSSENKDPLAYLHGRGNIIPGLEKELEGKGQGDKLTATINPEEAYGTRNEQLIQKVSMKNFQNPADVKVGVQFQVNTGNGSAIATVTAIENDEVTLDMNHPLADETLHFDVEVMEVREPTEDELAHGHVHGTGGHEH